MIRDRPSNGWYDDRLYETFCGLEIPPERNAHYTEEGCCEACLVVYRILYPNGC